MRFLLWSLSSPMAMSNFCSTGQAYVYRGSASGLATTAITTLTGEGTGNSFGWSVSGAGDVDGDGFCDVIIGAPGDMENGADSDGFGSIETFAGDIVCTSGADASTDCDDADPDIHPNAPEQCNVLDDNCDGRVDEGWPISPRCDDTGATMVEHP